MLFAEPRLRESALCRARDLPERVLQFGEGNFLRAFFDWMLERMNRRDLFNGRAVLIQPIPEGACERINRQNGLYNVLLRGIDAGVEVETRDLVTSVSRCVNPYREVDEFLRCAELPDLRFVVSNTTEAGIRIDPKDRLDSRPAPSFPGKLTQLLYARFQHFGGDPGKGWIMLPCELIERNGDALSAAVLQLAQDWSLPAEFSDWLSQACVFTNTLVDRIVTGFPKDEAEQLTLELGYRDALLVLGEVFHCWVIESPRSLEEELPLVRAGLDVTWTHDMTPYRERKVRILNGSHTLIALCGFLSGKDTVRDCMNDALFRTYVEATLEQEILPTLSLPRAEVSKFAASVLDRFDNPCIRHRLIDISLNSVSKYKARLLGTVLDNQRKFGKPSPRIAFALASLLAFYRGQGSEDSGLVGKRAQGPYPIRDEASVLSFFQSAWAPAADGRCSDAFCTNLVTQTLARQDFWGCAMNEVCPGFARDVAEHLHAICNVGPRAALERLVGALATDS